MKFILSLLVLFSAVPLFTEEIILKDGVKIEGEFEGALNDVYMIRTKYGVLNVKKEEILFPETINLKSEKKTAPAASTTAETVELSTETLIPELAENILEYRIFSDTDGVKKIFLENGVETATRAFNLKNELVFSEGAIKDGKYSEYYPDGKIKAEKEYADGLENGSAKIYYPSGNLQNKTGYKNGLLDGPVFIYSPEGKLLFEQNYIAGILDGWVREYDDAGAVKKQTLYTAGIPGAASGGKEIADAAAEQPAPKKKIEINDSPLSAKKIELARGEKYIIYLEKKQKAVLILDKTLNLISRSGKLPDGTLKIINEEDALEKEFTFKGNKIENLKIFNPDGSEKASYRYDEKDLAVKK